jgi:uncharacterized protein YciI
MTEERIRELTRNMLRKKLYVVLSKGGVAPEKIAEHLPKHLEYMIGLEKKGVLFASGPLAEADGKTRGDGLTILRAASAENARRIAEADPFVVAGLRTFELREWTVMEGSNQGEFLRPDLRAGIGWMSEHRAGKGWSER